MRVSVLNAVDSDAKDSGAITFLSDSDGQLLDLLGLRHKGAGPDGFDLAQSASFLFRDDGTLLWHQLAPNYRVRPEPDEVLAAFDALRHRL